MQGPLRPITKSKPLPVPKRPPASPASICTRSAMPTGEARPSSPARPPSPSSPPCTRGACETSSRPTSAGALRRWRAVRGPLTGTARRLPYSAAGRRWRPGTGAGPWRRPGSPGGRTSRRGCTLRAHPPLSRRLSSLSHCPPPTPLLPQGESQILTGDSTPPPPPYDVVPPPRARDPAMRRRPSETGCPPARPTFVMPLLPLAPQIRPERESPSKIGDGTFSPGPFGETF
mmetsp:Transcript_5815/g.12786  ORF Transcript_5815/g.12786 Transcript_5815/m.12786 type:complete len:230 (-) Transcript_5815:864-1553(-)